MSKLRLGFRSSLECDVYHIIRKLESAHDDEPFKSVPAAYDAIRRSNSSLSRQKKRPLEDAISRMLQMRKQEQQGDSDDSEAAVDEPPQAAAGDERFLLNRQMTRLWKPDVAARSSGDQPAAKKRRIQAGADAADADDDGASGPETGINGSGTAAAPTSAKQYTSQSRRPQKASRFTVEQPEQLVPLAGIGDAHRKLLGLARNLLRGSGLYEGRNLRQTPGILLSGPPGTGKTSLVKNVAAMLGVPLVSLAGCLEDPERMERSLSEAVNAAMSLAPSIVFVDRIDWYMSRPGSLRHSEHHMRAVSQFANQMKRMRGGPGRPGQVLAMATTSRVADVDPTVLEYGLLETTVQMRIPDCAARRDILEAITAKMELADDVDLAEIANMTHGYVGSDLVIITTLAGERLVDRIASAHDAGGAMLDLDGRPGSTHEYGPDARSSARSSARPFFTRTIADPGTVAPLTMDDFKAAIQEFTPSLRKEGFTVIPSVTWDQVGALDAARKQLQTSIIGPIKRPELYRSFGLTRPAGVLLWGPPGCGKTLVAQAVANEAQASFILINGPELLNKYIGESERAVRELFQRARSSTPCILFFDEMDSIVPQRSSASTEAGARVVNALLTELDGARDRTGIYVIGTTNRPDLMDEAMLRPGRLSVQLLIDLPTPAERVEILRAIYRTRHEHAPDKALERLAVVALDARCTDFSGADLSGLHAKAAEHALERWMAAGGLRVIADADWQHALDNARASVRDPASYRRPEAAEG